MPLIQSKSKKAFKKNVETEMEANPGKENRAQNLAVAYSIKRKNSKKMAQGGAVSASDEKRPMPDATYNDSSEARRNSSDKALHNSDWTGRPTVEQAQRPSKTALSQPEGRRLQGEDDEDDMMTSMSPGSYDEQPPSRDDEMGAKRQGPKVSDMERQHSSGRQAYAQGGRVRDSGEGLMERDDEEDLMSSAHPSSPSDEPKSSYDESHDYGMAPMSADEEHPHTGESEADMLRRHAMELAHFAKGGPINPKLAESRKEPEEEGSMAKEIMGKRKVRKDGEIGGADSMFDFPHYADGGEVDLEANSEEDLNNEDQMSFKAGLKEQYDLRQLSKQPRDSNEMGDDREADEENEHDDSTVGAIRRKMKKRVD